MPYLDRPETDDETRYLTTEANDAMADVRTYLREIASIDDDTLDELTDAEVSSLAREFAEAEPY